MELDDFIGFGNRLSMNTRPSMQLQQLQMCIMINFLTICVADAWGHILFGLMWGTSFSTWQTRMITGNFWCEIVIVIISIFNYNYYKNFNFKGYIKNINIDGKDLYNAESNHIQSSSWKGGSQITNGVTNQSVFNRDFINLENSKFLLNVYDWIKNLCCR